MTEPTKPMPTYSPACICTHEWQAPVPGTLKRFGTWIITKVEADCLAHGYTTRINLAADLRYGD
jgi:hypothetical protein